MRAASILLTSIAVWACAPVPPPAGPSLLPPPLVRPAAPEVYARVTANPDAARILTGLSNRGLVATPDDVSQAEFLAPAPGYVWRVGSDWLHVHVYPDQSQASAATQRFVAMVMSRSQIIDWVGAPRLFQCGSAVVLFLGDKPQALNVLTYMCGPPRYDPARNAAAP